MLTALLAGSVLIGRGPLDEPAARFRRGLAQLERTRGGRLGVAVYDAQTGRTFAYRGDERFLMCSTHKLLSAAFVLSRVDRKRESLGRRVAYPKSAILPHSPATEPHAGGRGLTMGELCRAAVTVSDNAAANLLFESFGGPKALTAYLRTLGDRTTRSDRTEPTLNDMRPGDPRDTTTPKAMTGLVRTLLLGDALSKPSRDRLAEWLVACETGDARLRAGVPKAWRAGDKTGTGAHGETNDVAIFWRKGKRPLIVAAYYAGSRASSDARNAVLADVGRLAAAL